MKIRILLERAQKFHIQALVSIFFLMHLILIIFIDNVTIFSPDEIGYLATFNNIYSWPPTTTAQSMSGWITAPSFFLWILYLPAKLLTTFGVDGLFALRFQSIAIISLTLYYVLNFISQKIGQKWSRFILVISLFSIPSVFFWTSTGLRETYILVGLILMFFGVHYLFDDYRKKAVLVTISGSYILICTKPYLWVIMILAILLLSFLLVLKKISYQRILLLNISALVAPLIAFSATTSIYALNFIFQTDISDVGARSGDSVTTEVVNVNGVEETITFRGDFTLVSLQREIVENPNSLFVKFLITTGIDEPIRNVFEKRVNLTLQNVNKGTGSNLSEFNSHILQPARLDNPFSWIRAAAIFALGPIPFIESSSLFIRIVSLESPIWWALFLLIGNRLFKIRNTGLKYDPQIILALIFLLGFLAFSALIQVNTGTAFRHRSVLLIPILVLLIRSDFLNKLKVVNY